MKYRVLVVHNAYQHRGGEDSVVEDEIALLHSQGHEIATYFRSNDDISDSSQLSAAKQTLWSSRTSREIKKLILDFRPDIIHVHNTFAVISPSLYWAAEHTGVPVVQTLHNFRFLCLNALYLRDNKVCEDCSGHLPWRGVINKCYRGSVAGSAVLASMLALHRGIGTYSNKITRYIALNNFCRNKFIEGGLPADRISVKPNFVSYPNPKALLRKGILYVGRFSIEKGIDTLVSAASLLVNPQLRVAGSGPLEHLVKDLPGVTVLGSLAAESVRDEMNRASALVITSIWYENFPRTIVEAFAAGLPVIASRIGALAELVCDGETGLLFEPGNAQDLAEKMTWALDNPEAMAEMGYKARQQYEAEFTPEQNYVQLMAIYDEAIRERNDGR